MDDVGVLRQSDFIEDKDNRSTIRQCGRRKKVVKLKNQFEKTNVGTPNGCVWILNCQIPNVKFESGPSVLNTFEKHSYHCRRGGGDT